jgi:hypothetical protein
VSKTILQEIEEDIKSLLELAPPTREGFDPMSATADDL